MEWAFGNRQTSKEIVKEHQKIINKAVREIEREKNKLQRCETKIIADIKKTANEGQMGAARIMAKDLTRTRKHVERMYKMKTGLQAASSRIQTAKSGDAISVAAKGITDAMIHANGSIDLPSLERIAVEFQKQNEIMNLKEETVGDTLDEMWESDDEEAETDDILNRVSDDIGIKFERDLVDAPAPAAGKKHETETRASPEKRSAQTAEMEADRDLQNRLENLRRQD